MGGKRLGLGRLLSALDARRWGRRLVNALLLALGLLWVCALLF